MQKKAKDSHGGVNSKKYDQRAQLLEVARAGDADAVRSFVDGLWFRACETSEVSDVQA